MVWAKAGSTTLGSAGDTCNVTGLSNNKFNMILFHRITDGNTRGKLRFNNDSGSNYAERYNNRSPFKVICEDNYKNNITILFFNLHSIQIKKFL